MGPATWQQALLVVAFVLPGFVLQSVRLRLRGITTSEGLGSPPQVFGAIAATVGLDAIYFWLLGSDVAVKLLDVSYVRSNLSLLSLGVVIGVFILPALAAVLFSFVSLWIQRRSFRHARQDFWRSQPYVTSWDYFADLYMNSGYVRIQFKDGKWVGGYLGPDAHMSTHPAPRDVYLSCLWKLDTNGSFLPRGESQLMYPEGYGAWVNCADAVSFEIFNTPPWVGGGDEVRTWNMVDQVESDSKWVAASSDEDLSKKGLKPTSTDRRPSSPPPDPTPVDKNK